MTKRKMTLHLACLPEGAGMAEEGQSPDLVFPAHGKKKSLPLMIKKKKQCQVGQGLSLEKGTEV